MGKNKYSKQPAKLLLSLICSKIYETDLRIIAENDYGEDVEKHYQALECFRNSLDAVDLDSWYPLEVMELERWKTPSNTQEREHLRRAFCCLGILTDWLETKATFDIYDVVCPLAESLTNTGWDFFQPFDHLLEYALSQFEYIEDIAGLELVRLYLSLQMKRPQSKIRNQLNVTLDAENKAIELLRIGDETESSIQPFALHSYVTHKSACTFIGNQLSNAADSTQELDLKTSLKNLSDRVLCL